MAIIFFCPCTNNKFVGNSFSCSVVFCRNIYVLTIMLCFPYVVGIPHKHETPPYPHFPESCREISEPLCDQLLVQDKLQVRPGILTMVTTKRPKLASSLSWWSPWFSYGRNNGERFWLGFEPVHVIATSTNFEGLSFQLEHFLAFLIKHKGIWEDNIKRK
jgi:hypothetical protein